MPVFVSHTPLNFAGNIIALVYLLALGTFFLILAGLDAGSAFGGMGSSREAIVATLAEPAMMLSILSIALTAGSTNLSTIVHQSALMEGMAVAPPAHLMALAALFMVTLAETGRVPVDNPATHLELTMIHEAMLLEYSGRYLALMEWAAGIKLLVFLTLIVNVFAPWGIATSLAPSAIAVGLLVYLGKVAGLAIVIGVIESMFAKLRLFRVPEMLGAAFILSLLALVFFLHIKKVRRCRLPPNWALNSSISARSCCCSVVLPSWRSVDCRPVWICLRCSPRFWRRLPRSLRF
jgi:formate hydrogenlyase subunit 4